MKIAVVGTGAMGSIYAGLLADAGNEVWAVDRWEAHVDAIGRTGLRVEGASGDRTVAIPATTDVAEVGPCDLYIVATKADGVGSAAQAIAPLLAEDSLVLTIQNGLGAFERIAEHIPAQHVVLGVAQGFGAAMVGPGHVHHPGMALIRLGEPSGGPSARVDALVELWTDAGFEVASFDDIQQLIWEKFVCNVGLSGPCTVTGLTVGEMMDTPEFWAISQACATEAYEVGSATGVAFGFDDPAGYLRNFAGGLRPAKPSMLQDHEAGRRSEIDAINGQVSVRGRALGIATPANDMVSAIVRARETRF
ncbi:MAG: 2-dehydropantoate 2-reductase [Actinomycetota bacterium]